MTAFCDRHPLLDADELATAAALWAAALPDPSACGGGRIVVPRFPLRDLLSGDAGAGAGLASLLARHSFVVLTLDAGQNALAERYATMEREGERFFAVGDDRKRACASSRVHRNERGVPMWHCGYERCAGREAFRVDAPAMKAGAAVASGERCADDASVWPSRGFADAWTDLAHLCRAITDAALVHVMRGAAAPACEPSATPLADDLSVCYALHYPNTAAPVASECVRGDQVWNVAPHVDPSLLVVEPCSRARGLEVRARSGAAGEDARAALPGTAALMERTRARYRTWPRARGCESTGTVRRARPAPTNSTPAAPPGAIWSSSPGGGLKLRRAAACARVRTALPTHLESSASRSSSSRSTRNSTTRRISTRLHISEYLHRSTMYTSMHREGGRRHGVRRRSARSRRTTNETTAAALASAAATTKKMEPCCTRAASLTSRRE